MSQGFIALGLVVCVLVAASCLLVAIRLRTRGESGLDTDDAAAKRDGGGRMRALGAVLRPEAGEALDELRSRTVQAGLYGRDAIDLFLTVRLIAMVAGAGLILSMASVFGRQPMALLILALAIGSAAVMGPRLWLDGRKRRRQTQVARALPEMIDLLVVCLEAGLGLRQALERVVEASGDDARSELLSDELQMVLADVKVGMTVERAFDRFGARIGSEEATAVAALMSRGASLGARVAGLLRGHADSMREHQLLQLEESTGKANAKLALPLALCLLPAALFVMVGPAFLALFESL